MPEFHPEIRIIGDPILTCKAKQIDCYDQSLLDLIQKMTKLMTEANGVGIAANQVGSDLAVFITNAEGTNEVVINPEILEKTESIEAFHEGCLSLPGVYCHSNHRFNVIKVRYRDIKDINTVIEKELRGLPAVVFQHETDHLNGKLYIDGYGPIKRSMAVTKHKKYMRMLIRNRSDK